MPVSLESQAILRIREFTSWKAVPSLAAPASEEVHVWYAIREAAMPGLPNLQEYLDDEEKSRAARLKFENHRNHFVLSHAMLRLLIAGYCGIAPQQICFSYGPHGKPAIDANLHLTFNLSHADDIVLCAFAWRRDIGADVECVRNDFDVEEIGERFFSSTERQNLRRVPPEHKHDAFFRLWTRKEAYIKARGEGLSHPLHQFDVSLGHSGNLLMSTRPSSAEAHRWIIRDVEVPHGYVAAVSLEARPAE